MKRAILLVLFLALLAFFTLAQDGTRPAVAEMEIEPNGLMPAKTEIVHSTAWSNAIATGIYITNSPPKPPHPITWRFWLADSNTTAICVIQRSTNLIDWRDVGSFPGTNMLYTWTDPAPPSGHAYYRVANYGAGYPIILPPAK